MSILEDLEDLVIAHIKANVASIKTCRKYQGDFDEESLTKLRGLFPCALVLYGGGSFIRRNKTLTGSRGLTIFLGAKDLRGTDKSRMGTYEIIEDITEALDHETFGEYILDLASESLVYHDKSMTICAQEYKYELKGRTSSRQYSSFIPIR